MYEKIAHVMNERFGSMDMDAGLVETYLRTGNDSLLSANEVIQIEVLLDKFL